MTTTVASIVRSLRGRRYADGKAIGRNPGQVRFELLVDHGGTPTDPFDDEVIAELGVVKEETGRNDDFCAAVVPALM